MTATEVEPTHENVMLALGEWSDELRSVTVEQRALVARMRECIAPLVDDLTPTNGLHLGQHVKVWGDWFQLVEIRRERDLFGHDRVWLMLRDDAKVVHPYEAGEHERFVTEEPF